MTTPRRSLVRCVIGCLAGAGLALFAATRTWSLEVIARPGLPDLRTARTGADEVPVLVGLALVGLAGAGALLATRGLPRRLLGGLLAVVGAGIIAGAIAGRTALDAGQAGPAATVWPIACVVGGALIVVGGVGAARLGHTWPAMGSRYERRSVPPPDAQPSAGAGPSASAGPNRPQDPAGVDQRADVRRVDTRAAWEALDRGDDPTVR
jgi:uncharacterized membrane protein (TIGR02234 family)